jgi:hypothetical protein
MNEILNKGLLVLATVQMGISLWHTAKGNHEKALRYDVAAILSLIIYKF